MIEDVVVFRVGKRLYRTRGGAEAAAERSLKRWKDIHDDATTAAAEFRSAGYAIVDPRGPITDDIHKHLDFFVVAVRS